jgi:hypothetical protein
MKRRDILPFLGKKIELVDKFGTLMVGTMRTIHEGRRFALRYKEVIEVDRVYEPGEILSISEKKGPDD